MGLESQRPTPAGASFINMQAPQPRPSPRRGAFTSPQSIQVTVSSRQNQWPRPSLQERALLFP